MKYEELVKALKDKCEVADASSVNEHVAIQFNVRGEAEGAFYLEITEGKVKVEPYEYYDRDVLVSVNENDLVDIFEGKKDFVELFNNGELQAEGNLVKALALKSVLEANNKTKKSVAKKAKEAVATAKAATKAATKAVKEKKSEKKSAK